MSVLLTGPVGRIAGQNVAKCVAVFSDQSCVHSLGWKSSLLKGDLDKDAHCLI